VEEVCRQLGWCRRDGDGLGEGVVPLCGEKSAILDTNYKGYCTSGIMYKCLDPTARTTFQRCRLDIMAASHRPHKTLPHPSR
jgi:hypothetical protein